jgi:hypothetical protein
MPTTALSDFAVDVMQVRRDGIRFRFYGQLHDLYERGDPVPRRNERPPLRMWVMAASPPPQRGDGTDWGDAMLRKDGTEFQQADVTAIIGGGNLWKEHGLSWGPGVRPLREPAADTVILHQSISVPFGWGLEVDFPDGNDIDQVGFRSEPYPRGDQLVGRTARLNHYGEFTLPWTSRPIETNRWVAISFERFDRGRRSKDYIAQVTPGFLFRPTP